MDEYNPHNRRDAFAAWIINFTLRHIATTWYADRISGIIGQGVGTVYGPEAYADWASRQR